MAVRLPNSALRELIGYGYIAPFRCAGHEILRRVFVTVRDRHWQEVAPTQWDSAIEGSARTATLRARHTSELVDFEWQGSLQVSEDLRTLRFAFDGRALRDMDVCRLGLIVLHPIESLIGARLTAIGPQGQQCLTVAHEIYPQPIAHGVPGAMTEPFSELTIARADFGVLKLHFGGELFELEDQRNWGDASFKTYCTPLRLGFPRAMKAGTSIAHSVDIHFTPAPARAATPISKTAQVKSRSPRNEQHDLRLVTEAEEPLAALPGAFPTIGREWNNSLTHGAPGKEEPAWHHIHLDLTGPADAAALLALLKTPSPANIEVVVEAEDDRKPAADLLSLLCQNSARISRLLIYGPGASPPAAAAVERWHQGLAASVRSRIPLLAATRGYYVEFNRAVALDAPVSGIAFPLTATVHSDDAATIADNVATIRDMTETARRLTRLSELVVTPLALYYPASAKPQRFPRQLVAPWLAATLIHAAAARITSITFAEDIVHAITPAEAARASPFLTRLIACAGLEVRLLDAALPPGLHAIALKQMGQTFSQLLVANLAMEPAVLSRAGTAQRAVEARDAVTGARLATSGARIEVPALGVAWIEPAM